MICRLRVIDLATLLKIDGEVTLVTPAELLQAASTPQTMSAPQIVEAQQRRPDLAASAATVEARRAFAQEPNARFLPSVLFNAQTRNVNDGPLTSRANEGFFGFSFAWPVFDAGLRRAERIEREAVLRGAELQLELERRDVEREMRSAAVQLATEQSALREAAAALRAARKNAEETSVLYREGLASALELADANRQLFESEVAEVTARFRMAIAYLALREAEGLAPYGTNGRMQNAECRSEDGKNAKDASFCILHSAFCIRPVLLERRCPNRGRRGRGSDRKNMEFPVEVEPVESRKVEYTDQCRWFARCVRACVGDRARRRERSSAFCCAKARSSAAVRRSWRSTRSVIASPSKRRRQRCRRRRPDVPRRRLDIRGARRPARRIRD